MLQIRTINKIANKFDFKLIKCKGYFEWIPMSIPSAIKTAELPTCAVFAERVNDLTLTEWLTELEAVSLEKIEK